MTYLNIFIEIYVYTPTILLRIHTNISSSLVYLHSQSSLYSYCEWLVLYSISKDCLKLGSVRRVKQSNHYYRHNLYSINHMYIQVEITRPTFTSILAYVLYDKVPELLQEERGQLTYRLENQLVQ